MGSRLQDEADFQDKRTEAGGALRKFNHLIDDAHPYLIQLLGSVDGKKVLTMGCATGGVTPFAREGAFVVGVDVSSKSLKQLRRAIEEEGLTNHASVSLVDCESLAFKAVSFDVVLFLGVLHHLEVRKTLQECYRVLKPGGSVYMFEPLGLHPIVNVYRLMTPDLRTKFEHPLMPKDFKVMREYFKIEEFRGFCLLSIFSLGALWPFPSETIYQKLRAILLRVDNLIFKYIPFSRYFAWSTVIKLKKI